MGWFREGRDPAESPVRTACSSPGENGRDCEPGAAVGWMNQSVWAKVGAGGMCGEGASGGHSAAVGLPALSTGR